MIRTYGDHYYPAEYDHLEHDDGMDEYLHVTSSFDVYRSSTDTYAIIKGLVKTERVYCGSTADTRRERRYLCIGGPASGQRLGSTRAEDAGYVGFNNSAGRAAKHSKIFVHERDLI